MSIQTLKIKDDIKPSIGLSPDARKGIAKNLSASLASTYTLYLKTLYYHWNVTGPNFGSLHTLFEEQYENLHEAGDEIAERIRALGFMTPGTISEFQELTAIKEDEKLPENWKHMVANLVEGNEVLSNLSRKVLEVAEEYDDEVTIDMMVNRMKYHDESAWMLRSTIEEEKQEIS